MLGIRLICSGKIKENGYLEAVEEYVRRLRPYCRMEVVEIAETRLPANPTSGDIEKGLEKEAREIEKNIFSGAFRVAMCIEGSQCSSREFAALIKKWSLGGVSRICFAIGSSHGLHESIKSQADYKMSMSEMTFPHSLARVLLSEQIYRAFMINEGTKYHK